MLLPVAAMHGAQLENVALNLGLGLPTGLLLLVVLLSADCLERHSVADSGPLSR